MRLHETGVHRKTTIPTNVVPRFIPTNCRRRNSIGKYRWNSDDFAVNRNVVGISSEYTDELPTTTTVTFFIGMSSKSRRNFPTNHISSEFRRKWPTEFRRLIFFGFGRKFVSIPSQMSDDLGVRRNLRRNSMCFLVVLAGIWNQFLQSLHPLIDLISPLLQHNHSGDNHSYL
ncbi:hypothetical protein F2Q70_00000009 [Brassica cretica]|uniref:Uncharacterized protein n=1 Tax=Brassica cretica TaxID=69181 RepID=A0A8S9J332_BRACR|nr:hypothetical protein F2Q70_00000009 [Brassica cretica]